MEQDARRALYKISAGRATSAAKLYGARLESNPRPMDPASRTRHHPLVSRRLFELAARRAESRRRRRSNAGFEFLEVGRDESSRSCSGLVALAERCGMRTKARRDRRVSAASVTVPNGATHYMGADGSPPTDVPRARCRSAQSGKARVGDGRLSRPCSNTTKRFSRVDVDAAGRDCLRWWAATSPST